MMRRLALLTTAALLLVPPLLHAQTTLTRGGGGSIGVLGPASAFQTTGANAIHLASARGVGTTAGMQPNMQNRRKGGGGGGNGGGCTIYGFLGGLANGSTLNSIGVFDLTGQTTGNFALGTATPTASATGGALSANLGAAPQGNVAGQITRNAGTLFQYATDPNCGSGAPFTTTLTSNPTGSAGTVVATANTLRMQATYTTQYVADPNNPYYCYYTNNPNQRFLCNIWSANVTFDFLSNSFAALGAGTYTLNIVQATITSP